MDRNIIVKLSYQDEDIYYCELIESALILDTCYALIISQYLLGVTFLLTLHVKNNFGMVHHYVLSFHHLNVKDRCSHLFRMIKRLLRLNMGIS